MRIKKEFSRKGFDYKIVVLVITVILLIAGFFVYSYYQKKYECNTENYDIFYYLTALKTNDASVCGKIFMDGFKKECIAVTEKNAELCKSFDEGRKIPICPALAKRDAALCGSDESCEALITRDPSVCNIIETDKYLAEQNLTVSESKRLKNICTAYANLDADFFLSKERLRTC